MLLPFLPLLSAVLFLSWVQSLPSAAPEPLLGWPIPGVLCGLVAAGAVLAQALRNLPGGLANPRWTARFGLPRMVTLGLWAASVELEALPLRLAASFPKAFTEEGAFSVLILTYWLADAMAATPVSRWDDTGRRLKLSQVQNHLRLQLPLLVLGGGQALLLQVMQAIPGLPTSGLFGLAPVLLSLALLITLAPPVIMGCWQCQKLPTGSARHLKGRARRTTMR